LLVVLASLLLGLDQARVWLNTSLCLHWLDWLWRWGWLARSNIDMVLWDFWSECDINLVRRDGLCVLLKPQLFR
jgi:hypothetical protein